MNFPIDKTGISLPHSAGTYLSPCNFEYWVTWRYVQVGVVGGLPVLPLTFELALHDHATAPAFEQTTTQNNCYH